MLVSVILPCFGHATTLPAALRSLQAQTYSQWECLVINDGGGAAVDAAIEAFAAEDSRFRREPFAENQGRGAARQRGLELARGRFIASLDADDAYLPEKLQRQVELLGAHPRLAAVSSAMVVVDGAGQSQGIRGAAPGVELRRCRPGHPLRTAFAPMMLRREVARTARFDPTLERAEDLAFLWRALAHRRYAVLPEPLYAYREEYSPEAMEIALKGFSCQRQAVRDLDLPRAEAALRVAGSFLRTAVYGAARAMGRGAWLFERRNSRGPISPISPPARRAYP